MGVAYALGYTILIAIMIFYILGSIGVGVICYLITKRIIPSVLLAIICLISVPIYREITDKREKEKYAKLKQERVQEAHRRRNNLLQACKTESKMTVYQKIPAQSGIFIEGGEIEKSENVIPTRFLSQKQQEEMGLQLSKLFEQCEKNNTNSVYSLYSCREQYKVSISWAVQSLHEPDIIKMSDAAFLQNISYVFLKNFPSDEWQQKYRAYYAEGRQVNTYGEIIDTDSLRRLKINGTKKWWRESGLEHIAKEWKSSYNERKDSDIISIPSFRIYAPYRLARYDISTVIDRQKGIRRGRIALEEISSNRVLSEYIGFEVVPYINGDTGSLNCFSDDKGWNEYMKYGDSSRALSSSNEDIVFEHFFNHAVDKTKKAKIEKVTVFP